MNIQNLLRSIRNFWTSSSYKVKALTIGGGIVIISLIILFIFLGTKVTYDVLFSNLSPQDAAAVTSKLREMGESYRLTEGGTAVLVPKDRVYEVRLALASQNIPSGGGVGFEIFDKTSLGTTDFVEKINYQRALQGELSKTISSLSNVEYARVHIVLPRERLYAAESVPPQAGVVLKLKPGAIISKSEVMAIARLVASSIEGLKPESVTIVDTNGNMLSRGLFKDEATTLDIEDSLFLEVKDKIEKTIEERIQSMLTGVLGPNRAIVRTSIELDLTQLKVSSETFSPVVEESGIIRKEERTKESYEGQGAPGGVPGVSSNIPGYEAIQTTGGTSTHNKQQINIEYEINRQVQEVLEKPGKIKKLSVAVVVDKNLTLQEQQSIINLASAAAGVDLKRGDQLTVQGIPFDKTYYQQEEAAIASELAAQRKQQLLRLIIIVVAIIIGILIIWNIVKSIIKPVRRIGEAVLPEEIPIEVEEKARPISAEDQRRREVTEQVIQLAKRDPQSFVKLLRSWMKEER